MKSQNYTMLEGILKMIELHWLVALIQPDLEHIQGWGTTASLCNLC